MYAVSMQRAEALLSECEAHDKRVVYGSAYTLAELIRKQAAKSCGVVDPEKVHTDEVEGMDSAIKRAEIDDGGDVVVPVEEFA